MIRKTVLGSIQSRFGLRGGVRGNGLMKHVGGCNNNVKTNAIIASLCTRNYNTSKNPTNSLNNHTILKKHNKSSLSWAALGSDEYYESSNNSMAEKKEIFPSIIIDRNGIEPQGSFAEAQTEFLDPDMDVVKSMSNKLSRANMGIVAHYYMDVELQSVLQQVSKLQEEEMIKKGKAPGGAANVAIADSLAMGEYAVKMVEENNITSIACLGVDFMAESVSAILGRNGYGHVPVYRATPQSIGCSLAASAETDTYEAWLRQASNNPNPSLHVIYINTSLETKAISASIIPTITCTSSNVIKTLLQASSQIGPDLQIYFGPDTYMGENLLSFFSHIIDHPSWTDEKIKQDLHAYHTNDTLAKLRDNINVFPSGNCVVHHMFGSDVVDTVKQHYDDAFITAHLEVPSEMFNIAMSKSIENKGVVGSTSDILKFISNKVKQHSDESSSDSSRKEERLKFVLGTEAGMVTSIVRNVQDILNRHNNNIQAEIIFPVASDAITQVQNDDDLVVVPGVSATEGCSTSGGCATCPFMKMNDLNALEDVIDLVIDGQKKDTILMKHLPPNKLLSPSNKARFGSNITNVMDLAVQPIMFMRHYMKNGVLSDDLLQRIRK